MRFLIPAVLISLAALTGAAQAESVYTTLDTDDCEVLETFEGGGIDLLCEGLDGIDVFVSDGDARMDVDYGVRSGAFETFFAFNGVGETIEWMLDADGVPYAAALRFHIDVDGRSAEALVVSRIGSERAPGCVVGVVDATAEQANGVARGLGAMAPLFDCATDQVVIVPGASELVAGFGGANR
ncbi:MAG TPA: hypothetical protein VGN80_04340 [Devosiaceae bacterium]|jgi:hypothetical protein|nr:hypothetical protein [Devosiaceae bacterium]